LISATSASRGGDGNNTTTIILAILCQCADRQKQQTPLLGNNTNNAETETAKSTKRTVADVGSALALLLQRRRSDLNQATAML